MKSGIYFKVNCGGEFWVYILEEKKAIFGNGDRLHKIDRDVAEICLKQPNCSVVYLGVE